MTVWISHLAVESLDMFHEKNYWDDSFQYTLLVLSLFKDDEVCYTVIWPPRYKNGPSGR